ncbi:hypothetical protein [Streptomyces sp. NPDC089799]
MTTTATTHRVRLLAAPGDRHDEILTAGPRLHRLPGRKTGRGFPTYDRDC